jgi:hypothetical protein
MKKQAFMCEGEISGFKAGKRYDCYNEGTNSVVLIDENFSLRFFTKTEGYRDFKNWFYKVK